MNVLLPIAVTRVRPRWSALGNSLQAPPSAIAEPAPGEQDHEHDDQQDEKHRADGDSAEDRSENQDDDEQLE
jgi:hypothetical protein